MKGCAALVGLLGRSVQSMSNAVNAALQAVCKTAAIERRVVIQSFYLNHERMFCSRLLWIWAPTNLDSGSVELVKNPTINNLTVTASPSEKLT